ncbi:DgyrCDS13091 [Dimorphilus gyrociliatus]|uniref:DgyrCDS13091 n=1 Tax=Dimorphilus gyrociliatus TaxID=2664684 RepID=A0A7I8W9L5_9ANNE|nr:DgyrCDS13091 [Dimorphilus gyrociliatus]
MATYDKLRRGYRVFIGDIGNDISIFDLDNELKFLGLDNLRDMWIIRRPPGFAFLVYKKARDAEELVQKLDGKVLCGKRVRVEHAKPDGKRGPRRKRVKTHKKS